MFSCQFCNVVEFLSLKLIDEVNILSFGAGDCRHILETMSNLFKKKKKVNVGLW